MSTQRFVDALSGADGTQALRVRYDVPPVYPDATVPVAPVRPTVVPRVSIRIPEIDPRVAEAVSELAAIDRPAPRLNQPRQRAPQAPAAPPPSRSQASRAGYYQGPMPTAIAPAAPSQHRQAPVRPQFPPAPSRPAGTVPGAADRLRSQLTQLGQQFGTGNTRTPPAMPSSPQSGPRSTVPASAFQPQPDRQRPGRRKANAVPLAFFVLIFLLVTTGLGAQLVEAISRIFER